MTRAIPPSSRLRFRGLLREIGVILMVSSLAMVASGVVAVIRAEWWSLLWFAVATLVTAISGRLLTLAATPETDLRQGDALAIAGAAWLAVAAFGGVPFLLAAHFTPADVVASHLPAGAAYESSLLALRDPLHALFESMSGWTTTGLTMVLHEPSLPESLLFYRSVLQWMGGAGVIVLALTVLQQHGNISGVHLYQAEGRDSRLRPSIAETARRVWRTYLVVTGAVAVYLFVATVVVLPDYPIGSALFDAVNHAMTGQSTGGFSTLDDSIGGYGSSAMEWVYLLPMLSGAIAVPVHYMAIWERRPSVYVKDVQNRLLFVLIVLGTPALVWAIAAAGATGDPVGEGVFQFVSAISTTGWQTADVRGWADTASLIVSCLMVIGAAAGATVGGIKLLRVLQITAGLRWQVTRFFFPSSGVPSFRVGGHRIDRSALERESGQAALFAVLWVVGLLAGVLVMTNSLDGGFRLSDMIFESASAQGTVGLSSGITGPNMPRAVEVTFILQMWIGRLEIIPVLVLARRLVMRGRDPIH